MKMTRVVLLIAAGALLSPHWARAQAPAQAAAPAATPAATADDPDLDINFSQPDFTVVTLPTTLRVPRFKSSFRVTHRFTRSLGQGDVGSLAEDFFSLDSGSVIGLEYRFGLARGLQAGVHRTSDRTIAFFGQKSLLQQSASRPIGLDVVVQIDGTNNFRDSYSPSLGVAISRTLGSHGAVYVDPLWVNNSNPLPGELADHNNTVLFGLGARIRVRPTVYVVGELVPRTGYTPGVNHATFGIEKRAGGHVFQLNFSNGFGTMLSQVARGGVANDDWYMGFNLSRKFF